MALPRAAHQPTDRFSPEYQTLQDRIEVALAQCKATRALTMQLREISQELIEHYREDSEWRFLPDPVEQIAE